MNKVVDMKVIRRDFMEVLPDERYSRLYKCKICEKVMTREYSLKVHILNHLNIKRFECDVCHKRFNSKTYLSDHQNIHTDTKPYVCDYENCTRRFRQRIKLCVHRRRVHNHISRPTPNHIDSSLYRVNTDDQQRDLIAETLSKFMIPHWIHSGYLTTPPCLQENTNNQNQAVTTTWLCPTQY
mmetsp:Transcript_48469/g.55758  ORF Transcript_48469/g.55758 Transcript_48469/m.55758 type:complete len:182 (+) Transcript_48469:77-622(+)